MKNGLILSVGSVLVIFAVMPLANAKTNPFAPKLHPDIQRVTIRGGVGDTFAQMQNTYGKPTRTVQKMSDGIGFYNYQNDLEVVSYESGRVGVIQYQFDKVNKHMSLSEAKSFALALLPRDIKFMKQEDKDENTRIYFYYSKTLAPLFEKDWTLDPNGKPQPGVCTIEILHTGNNVDGIGAAVGADP